MKLILMLLLMALSFIPFACCLIIAFALAAQRNWLAIVFLIIAVLTMPKISVHSAAIRTGKTRNFM